MSIIVNQYAIVAEKTKDTSADSFSFKLTISNGISKIEIIGYYIVSENSCHFNLTTAEDAFLDKIELDIDDIRDKIENRQIRIA